MQGLVYLQTDYVSRRAEREKRGRGSEREILLE
jgi:hypothetical protein